MPDITTLAQTAQATTPTAATQAGTQLAGDFETFLTLLTTQLQNQDPLEPLDTEQFTQQLVQFSGVEQSIQTNANLETLIALQSGSSNQTAISSVGRIATVTSDVSALAGDSQPAQWRFTLPADAATATAQIFNSAGALVANQQVTGTAGDNIFVWNGLTDAGTQAPDGAYRLVIQAASANGAPINAEIASRGRVDAVVFNNGNPEIEIAGQRFPIDLLSRIDNLLSTQG